MILNEILQVFAIRSKISAMYAVVIMHTRKLAQGERNREIIHFYKLNKINIPIALYKVYLRTKTSH